MLIDDPNNDHICRFPFYSLKKFSSNWIIGSQIMQEYYTVFNVSDSNPQFRIAYRNPDFEPESGSSIPDIIR